MKVAIQGQAGSACDEAAAMLCPDSSSITFEYCDDAAAAIQKLDSGECKLALLAMESPLGSAVKETESALQAFGSKAFIPLVELCREVHHCIMIQKGANQARVDTIASHLIPLKKHKDFLTKRFPGYSELVYPDPGAAACDLQKGVLKDSTAVIAMPRAAELFGLDVIERNLPANDGYLTRFALVGKSQSSLKTGDSNLVEVDGSLVRGHQVASGKGENSPYPAGTIEIQTPAFSRLGLDLSLYYPATLNISIAPLTFKMSNPDLSLPNVYWTDAHPPETFSFAHCKVISGGITAHGLIYYPHPETKVRHFQNASVIEVLAPFMPGLKYDMKLKIQINRNLVGP